jgi:AcrR family transcriptional regulator
MGRLKTYTREDVLDTSLQLFWKKGFADTSLQELEKATGVNKSGLYTEFSSKDDLFAQCLKQYVEKSGVLDMLSREPLGRENLKEFLLSSQKRSGANGCFMANSIREISILPREAKKQIESHILNVRKAVLSNIEAEYGVGADISLWVDILLSFNAGTALRHNLGLLPNLVEQVHQFLDFFLSAKKPPAS